MPKSPRKKREVETPHIVEPEPVLPNCPRCKQPKFSAVQKTVGKHSGVFVYCMSCGCIVGWAPVEK